MLQLYVQYLCKFVRDLARYELSAFGLSSSAEQATVPVSESDSVQLSGILEGSAAVASFMFLPATQARKERLEEALGAQCTYAELHTQLRMLREAMEDELPHKLVLFMPARQAVHFWSGPRLLGEAVADRFPDLISDIDEAGKCLGAGRFTAAVFHLMRVMEAGVRELGTTLGVPFVNERNWQPILTDINTAVEALPARSKRKAQMAEMASLLYAVKLAWRNEVMHPKGTYTEEEALNVLGATKAFMGRLVELVKSRRRKGQLP